MTTPEATTTKNAARQERRRLRRFNAKAAALVASGKASYAPRDPATIPNYEATSLPQHEFLAQVLATATDTATLLEAFPAYYEDGDEDRNIDELRLLYSRRFHTDEDAPLIEEPFLYGDHRIGTDDEGSTFTSPSMTE